MFFAMLMISVSRGTPSVTFLADTPAKWNVLSVICVVGSPIDCAATVPIISPGNAIAWAGSQTTLLRTLSWWLQGGHLHGLASFRIKLSVHCTHFANAFKKNDVLRTRVQLHGPQSQPSLVHSVDGWT
jgi:hypothetical protein